jgi:hypothetical protein
MKKAEYEWLLIDLDEDELEGEEPKNLRTKIQEMDSVIQKQTAELNKHKGIFKKRILQVMLF